MLTTSFAFTSARAAISRSTSATRPFCAAVWSSVCGIAPRREPALARLPARSPPPARAAQAPRLCSPAQPVLRPRAAPQLPRAPAKREPPPPRIPALQSTRAHTQPRTCAVLRAPPGSRALPAPRLLLLFSRSPGAPPRARVTESFFAGALSFAAEFSQPRLFRWRNLPLCGLFARPGQERSAEGPGAAAAILRAATDDRGGAQGAVWCAAAGRRPCSTSACKHRWRPHAKVVRRFGGGR